MSEPLHSCIYEGDVVHHRVSPKAHRFAYKLFMMYLDLDELPRVTALSRLWSMNRRAPAQFRRSDYLSPTDLPLADAVRQRIHAESGRNPTGPIRLLTHLRYFGHCFNPVSLYYCHDGDGGLDTIVADINNTPWNERHAYVLPCNTGEPAGDDLRFQFAKAFHISPFMPMNMQYDWRFSEPGDALDVRMASAAGNDHVFSASLAMARQEITAGALNGLLLRFPLMTIRVIGGIYWQAARLRLKRMPFYRHSDRAAPQDTMQNELNRKLGGTAK